MEEKIGEALRARLQSAQEHDTFDVNIFMAGEPADAMLGFADSEAELVDGARKSSGGAKASAGKKGRGAYKRKARVQASVTDVSAVTVATTRDVRILKPLKFVRSGSALAASADEDVTDAVEPTWSVKRVNAPLLWQLGLTGEGIVVAVVDTGVNYDSTGDWAI